MGGSYLIGEDGHAEIFQRKLEFAVDAIDGDFDGDGSLGIGSWSSELDVGGHSARVMTTAVCRQLAIREVTEMTRWLQE